jgi:hypothetical protein
MFSCAARWAHIPWAAAKSKFPISAENGAWHPEKNSENRHQARGGRGQETPMEYE